MSLVREPLRPELNLTTPVNVDPLIVATTELSIESVLLVLRSPPPERPVPAVIVVDVRALLPRSVVRFDTCD